MMIATPERPNAKPPDLSPVKGPPVVSPVILGCMRQVSGEVTSASSEDNATGDKHTEDGMAKAEADQKTADDPHAKKTKGRSSRYRIFHAMRPQDRCFRTRWRRGWLRFRDKGDRKVKLQDSDDPLVSYAKDEKNRILIFEKNVKTDKYKGYPTTELFTFQKYESMSKLRSDIQYLCMGKTSAEVDPRALFSAVRTVQNGHISKVKVGTCAVVLHPSLFWPKGDPRSIDTTASVTMQIQESHVGNAVRVETKQGDCIEGVIASVDRSLGKLDIRDACIQGRHEVHNLMSFDIANLASYKRKQAGPHLTEGNMG